METIDNNEKNKFNLVSKIKDSNEKLLLQKKYKI
tara:strand:+ start:529 stop:630 length:102 start_codon:yes stop_codon:yes gene_type:complete